MTVSTGWRLRRAGLLLLALLPAMLAVAAEPAAIADEAALATSAAPTLAEAEYYTRPLVRARLRLPDSLQDYRVASLLPSADDPSRFEVEVQFRARTPFGGVSAHSARFQMRRAAAGGWIVTAK